MSTGQRIKKLRTENKFSQEYLAEKLDVSRQAVSKWEQDIANPDMNNVKKLAELFDVSVEFILSGKESVRELVYVYVPQRIKWKKIILVMIVFCAVVSIAGFIWWGQSLPVSYDAGACGGGFGKHIFDKFHEELSAEFVENSDDGSLISDLNVHDDTYEVSWEGDTITLSFDISYTHSEYGYTEQTLSCFGKRVWFEVYDWKIAIEG